MTEQGTGTGTGEDEDDEGNPILPQVGERGLTVRQRARRLRDSREKAEHEKRAAHAEYRYACMYVCMVITYSRVWINRVRLPILLVVS